jgi:hypothetical protein
VAGSLPVLVSESLTKAGFRHAFTTRAGGVSEPPYEALDFAILRDADRLRENQRRLADAVGFAPELLFQTKQVHGRALVVAGGDPKARIDEEADALVAEPGTGHAVAVRVADCVPVLLAHRETGRVAAVHAGWRGVVAGVVGVAIERISKENERSFLVAAIGPCIGACCFEVGADVAREIASASSADVIARREGDKAFVDLRRAVRIQLRTLGVDDAAIDDVPSAEMHAGCTRCDRARFYSYRRDGDRSGRLVGVIVAR